MINEANLNGQIKCSVFMHSYFTLSKNAKSVSASSHLLHLWRPVHDQRKIMHLTAMQASSHYT